MDDRSLRAYFQQNSAWNSGESGTMDYFNFSSNSNDEKLLDSNAHFPSEMRSLNLNQMVSNIMEENSEYHLRETLPMFAQHQRMDYLQQMRNGSSRSSKVDSSAISESGYPRNIPDSSSTQYNPPKDIQVLVRKGDQLGTNSLIRNVSLQQFRQMIGLQRSSGLTTRNDRKNRHIKQQQQQQQQLVYPKAPSSISSIPPVEALNDGDSPTSQEISYFRSHRRTGVANTLHIAIEKCYEQLNYIRDSYAETESKIGICMFHKSSFVMDVMHPNLASPSNNPSRVDRLIAEYQHEYNRIIRLHGRIQEEFNVQDIEATRQTLDEWFNAIHIVQNRRRQEIENATEKSRSGDARLPDEKDVLQLAEALRVLRITTRKIRTVLWYWLYWSTNSSANKLPLFARYQDENLFYSSVNNDLCNIFESDIHGKKNASLLNENNKENQYTE